MRNDLPSPPNIHEVLLIITCVHVNTTKYCTPRVLICHYVCVRKGTIWFWDSVKSKNQNPRSFGQAEWALFGDRGNQSSNFCVPSSLSVREEQCEALQ